MKREEATRFLRYLLAHDEKSLACFVDREQFAEAIAAMIAEDPPPRLPQQGPQYVAGFKAGAEWARETDAALAADTYGGDPVNHTRTTNPDGTRTPCGEPIIVGWSTEEELRAFGYVPIAEVSEEAAKGWARLNRVKPTPDGTRMPISEYSRGWMDGWNTGLHEPRRPQAEIDAEYDGTRTPQDDSTHCTWTEDADGIWHGSCGVAWECPTDTPAANAMQYCPQCGKPLVHAGATPAVPNTATKTTKPLGKPTPDELVEAMDTGSFMMSADDIDTLKRAVREMSGYIMRWAANPPTEADFPIAVLARAVQDTQ